MKITALLACALLVACNRAKNDTLYSYQSSLGYKIEVPRGFGYSELDPTGQYFYFGYPNDGKIDLSTVELYEHTPFPCLSGASQIKKISSVEPEEEIEWGKVDFYDHALAPLYNIKDDPVCDPHHSYNLDGSVADNKAAYVLCSEKNGKAVLICISQNRDDPELAEKIFKTFRWIEK